VSAERDAILSAQYVALTTYRRDGTPVTTPVWAAAEGESLYLFSNATAGKVKRLHNSSRAAIAPCTATGKVTGAQLPAEAFILASDQMPKVWRLLTKKYGMAARLFVAYDRARALLRMQPSTGIVVHLSAQ
jgi:PPOX class probable F420-dependent enzyme